MKKTHFHRRWPSYRLPIHPQLSTIVAATLISLLALAAPVLRANDPKLSFKIPPLNIPLHIKGQDMNIVASGAISMARKDHDLNEMDVRSVREQGVVLQRRSPPLEVHGRDVIDEQHEMRVTHRNRRARESGDRLV